MLTTSLRRLLAAFTVCGLVGSGAPALAQSASSVQLYGLLDVSAGRFQLSGDPRSLRVDSGTLSNSYLGFKGTEDLGGGVKLKFALEHNLRVDTGNSGRYDGESFFGRNAYVGLEGQFGSTLLGRNMTPLYVATERYNAFGESYSFSPAMRQLFSPNVNHGMAPFFGDSTWDNSILFTSADSGGFGYRLIGGLGEGAAGSHGRNLGVDLSYDNGPFSGTVVYERVRNGLGVATGPAGFQLQRVAEVAASYDLNVVKFYGQYMQVRIDADANSRTTLYQLGATVPFGRGAFLAQFGSAKADLAVLDSTDRSVALGYDYHLSKRTDVYAVYGYDKITRYNGGNTLAAGMRMAF